MKEIYQILSTALNQEQRMTQISNNLANINTPGFKRDGTAFENALESAIAAQPGNTGTPDPANSADTGWLTEVNSYVDFGEGEAQTTGNPLDLSIKGEGFFAVQKNNQTYYTRAGNFKINERSELITPAGYQVLDANQRPITLNPNQGQPNILPDGTIYQGRNQVGRIGVVSFANTGALEKFGDGALFTAPAGAAPQAVAQPNVRQGALESSNVNTIDEMVRMIQTERSYQIQQKMMQNVDELTSRRLDVARS